MDKHLLIDKLDHLIPVETLNAYAEKYHDTYHTQKPFPHVVLDNIFDVDILKEIIHEFNIANEKWRQFSTQYEHKFQMSNDADMGTVSRLFMHSLNSQPFLTFLEKLTGIKGLLPDMSYSGGGLHSSPKGGKLGVHVDFNKNKNLNLYRRVNVIIYLNENWKEEYGGALELWDKDQKACITKVLPLFNRLAIFNTSSISFHGHPHPLQCPDNMTRKSLALYYYTAEERGEQSNRTHSTIFLNKDGKEEELGKRGFLANIKTTISDNLRR